MSRPLLKKSASTCGWPKAAVGVWAARLYTYSWVALGVSFVALKSEFEEFVETSFASGSARRPQTALEFVGVVETERAEYRLGADQRVIDNSASGSVVTRSITVSKKWVQSCRVEPDKASVRGVYVEFKAIDYAITTDVENIFEEVDSGLTFDQKQFERH
jgi:hypothetical protein